jgi:hypothetical protein
MWCGGGLFLGAEKHATFSTLFFVPPDSETWVVRGMGIESISAFAAVGKKAYPRG